MKELGCVRCEGLMPRGATLAVYTILVAVPLLLLIAATVVHLRQRWKRARATNPNAGVEIEMQPTAEASPSEGSTAEEGALSVDARDPDSEKVSCPICRDTSRVSEWRRVYLEGRAQHAMSPLRCAAP